MIYHPVSIRAMLMVYLIAFCKTEIPFILSIKILLFLKLFLAVFL